MTEPKNIHTQTIINRDWNTATRAIDVSFVFAFYSKEQYLTFRRLWKENYAALSCTIRRQKEQIKTTQRQREYAGQLQSKAHELKREAATQLLMLHAAKQEAHRQYLASRQVAQ